MSFMEKSPVQEVEHRGLPKTGLERQDADIVPVGDSPDDTPSSPFVVNS
jgi:hypothetical protein